MPIDPDSLRDLVLHDQDADLELGGGGGGAVDSVNGQTGAVVLTGDDIGPPEAHASTHEAGGSDPITNLEAGATVDGVTIATTDDVAAVAGAVRMLGPFKLLYTDVLVGSGSDEIQVIDVDTLAPTDGTFNLYFSGGGVGTTSEIPWDATAAQIQAAIEALPTFADYLELVSVTGGPLPTTPVTITYREAANQWVNFAVAQLDSTNLVDGLYALTETEAAVPQRNGRTLFDVDAGDILFDAQAFIIDPFDGTNTDVSFQLGFFTGDGSVWDTQDGGVLFDLVGTPVSVPASLEQRDPGGGGTLSEQLRLAISNANGTDASVRVITGGTLEIFGLMEEPSHAAGEADIYVMLATPNDAP